MTINFDVPNVCGVAPGFKPGQAIGTRPGLLEMVKVTRYDGPGYRCYEVSSDDICDRYNEGFFSLKQECAQHDIKG